MHHPDLIMAMSDDDIVSMREDIGAFADILFGPVNDRSMFNRYARLRPDGTYGQLSRVVMRENPPLCCADIRGLIFHSPDEVTANEEEEEALAYEGVGFEFFAKGAQTFHLEVHHSLGRLSVSILGEVSYEPQQSVGYYSPGDDEMEIPLVEDLFLVREMPDILTD